MRELLSELANLDGEFTEGDFVYSLIADHRPIAELASADTAAIPLLVACLRDDRLARVRFQAQRVRVGMVCAYTLLETPYVKHHLQFSCFPPDWHGLVSPTLDADELRVAWRDWTTWLAAHPFNGRSDGEPSRVRCSWQSGYPCTCPPSLRTGL